MTDTSEFPLIFERFKAILQPHAKYLQVKTDTNKSYYLDGPFSQKWNKEVFFGAAIIQKNYVSFYLMPVYMCPDLLEGMSPELKKHKQGKSCFNFKKVDDDLFAELSALTQKAFERFKREI